MPTSSKFRFLADWLVEEWEPENMARRDQPAHDECSFASYNNTLNSQSKCSQVPRDSGRGYVPERVASKGRGFVNYMSVQQWQSPPDALFLLGRGDLPGQAEVA
ncbi:hypothetical protein AB7M37_005408 [Sinorhizobium fredii]